MFGEGVVYGSELNLNEFLELEMIFESERLMKRTLKRETWGGRKTLRREVDNGQDWSSLFWTSASRQTPRHVTSKPFPSGSPRWGINLLWFEKRRSWLFFLLYFRTCDKIDQGRYFILSTCWFCVISCMRESYLRGIVASSDPARWARNSNRRPPVVELLLGVLGASPTLLGAYQALHHKQLRPHHCHI